MVQQHCSFTDYIYLIGYWDYLTYGLFSLYKSDWIAIGGFDLNIYKNRWGGEDWDLLDRYIALYGNMVVIIHSLLLLIYKDQYLKAMKYIVVSLQDYFTTITLKKECGE